MITTTRRHIIARGMDPDFRRDDPEDVAISRPPNDPSRTCASRHLNPRVPMITLPRRHIIAGGMDPGVRRDDIEE